MTELFDDTTPAPNQEQAPASQQSTDYTDLLAAIKNERGEQKFKSVEDLVKGYNSSQEFIGTLKTEKDAEAQAKADLAVKVKAQEELEELLKSTSIPKESEPTPTQDQPTGITQEDVVAILHQQEQVKVQAENVRSVREAVKAAQGDMEALVEKAGLAKEDAQLMASKYPEQFLNLLGVEAPRQPVPTQSSTVNTETFYKDKPSEVKRVMKHASSKDLISAWKAAGERSMARLESEE